MNKINLLFRLFIILSISLYSFSTMSLLVNATERYSIGDKIKDTIKTNYLQNRHPLHPKPFLELPVGSIKPSGWLREQLFIMKNGSTGHLDSLYSQVMGSRNGWLGGDGDVWERGPYWLDGLVPLAYILDDDELKAKVQPWVEWSIRNQRDDGYFGPRPSDVPPTPEPGLQRDRAQDWWPKMVMLKVLQQYYSATGDQRVINLMTRYFKYQLKELPKTPLGHWSWWGSQRGGDNLLMVYWLYNITGDKFLIDLASLIHQQTFDWTDAFMNSGRLSQIFTFHGVNLAQGIKEPVVYSQQDPDKIFKESVSKGFKDIRKYIGQPQGMYGADELTHGNAPTQGSEFCSAVEMMYSLENIMGITGDVKYMDHLEKIAFNALPTQASHDYMTHQYYQQANQVMVSREDRNFITAYEGTDNCYGLLTGYPCCTSNMHQGWPKFTQHLWMASKDGGVAALLYAPSTVDIKLPNGEYVYFDEETNYPFSEDIKFTYRRTGEKILFPFYMRIPKWCDEGIISVNGEEIQRVNGNQIFKLDREWTDGDVVTLTLPMKILQQSWNENAISVERGPLVYALKIEEKWKKIKNQDKYGDFFEVTPMSPWNYGLLSVRPEELQSKFKVVKSELVSDRPWSVKNSPVFIEAEGVLLPRWQLYNGSAGPLPYSPQPMPKDGKITTVTLIPYGCTTLRISEFPVVTRR